MSWIKEARQLVQDLIAPELRAIGVKVEALGARLDDQASAAEKRATERHLEVKAEISALRTEIALQIQVANLSRQVAELTAAKSSSPQ